MHCTQYTNISRFIIRRFKKAWNTFLLSLSYQEISGLSLPQVEWISVFWYSGNKVFWCIIRGNSIIVKAPFQATLLRITDSETENLFIPWLNLVILLLKPFGTVIISCHGNVFFALFILKTFQTFELEQYVIKCSFKDFLFIFHGTISMGELWDKQINH